MSARPPRLLFVCVENACRSQIAEGFTRALAAGSVEAASAGSRPSGAVNPRAIAFMRERGIDISEHDSKGLDELPADEVWDFVVTMGCGDACPHVPARARRDWALEDPTQLPDDAFRAVRDEIEGRVRALIEEAVASAAAD